MRVRRGLPVLAVILLAASALAQTPTIVIGGPDLALAPQSGTWSWDGSELSAYRGAITNSANFGPAGTVKTSISTVNLSSITAGTLAGLNVFIAPWWYNVDSANYAATVEAWFRAGGNLILLDDSSAQDQIAADLGFATSGSDGSVSNGGAPLFSGPFGSAANVAQNGTVGQLDTANLAAHGGFICATNTSGQVTALCFPAGAYAPGAGALLILGDVDMWSSQTALYSPLNSNGTFALNGTAWMLSQLGPQPVTVSPASISAATAGTLYSQTFTATGGSGSYVWSAALSGEGGALPGWLTISQTTGILSGTPPANGTLSIDVTATDTNGNVGRVTVSLEINFSGTVITTNLPAGMAIVNISANLTTPTVGGNGALHAASGGANQLWDTPFNTAGQHLRYTVQPGTYTMRVIDPADAAAIFPNLTANQLSSMWTAWTYNSPWITGYLVFDDSATSNSTQTQLFSGADGGPGTADAASAYADAVNGFTLNNFPFSPPFDNFIYPLIRNATPQPIVTFPLEGTGPETLIFAVPDDALGDNQGGVSVLIAPATSPPGVTTQTLPSGRVNVAYTQTTLTATGGSGIYLWKATGLPNGLTLSAAGLLSGTPTFTGNFPSVLITVTDPVSGFFDITVFSISIAAPLPALTITTPSIPQGELGVTYSQQIAATGGFGAYSWSISAGNAGPLSLNPGTGVLSSSGPLAGGNNSQFTVTVTDAAGDTFSRQYTLLVDGAVTIKNSVLPNAAVGESWATTLNAVGGTTVYTWSAIGLPAWLTMAPATGVLSGVPPAAGSYPFSVTVTDSANGTNTVPLSVQVILPVAYLVENSTSGLVFAPGDGSPVSLDAAVNGFDVARDAGGNTVVATGAGLTRVVPFVGNVSTIASAPTGAQWQAVAVDALGNFIVADNKQHLIWRISPDGVTAASVTSYLSPSTPAGENVRILVDVHGNYIVAEDHGGSVSLFSITPAGAISPVPLTGPALASVNGMTLDQNGNYMLLDSSQQEIFQITPQGTTTPFAGEIPGGLSGLARNPLTNEYVTGSAGRLYLISANGQTFTTLTNSAQLATPQEVAILTADFPSTVDATNPLAYFRLETSSGVSEVNGAYSYSLSATGAKISNPGAPIGAASNFALLNTSASQVTTSLAGHINTAGSIMAWVNLSQLPSTTGEGFNYVAGESASGNDLDLQFDSSNVLRFYTTCCNNSLSYTPAQNTLVGQWHMIVATFDATASTRAIYWDGALVASDNVTSSVNKTGNFQIGSSSAFSGRHFYGGIDEVAVWNYALTAPQVYRMFAARPPGISGIVSSLSPASGATNAAAPITISGGNFSSGWTVWWTSPGGPTTILTPTSVTANQIQATIPAGLLTTAGVGEVSVANASGVPSNRLPFTVQAPVTLSFTPPSGALPSGQTGQQYSQTLTASGGAGNYSWSITSQSPGLNLLLSASTGTSVSLTGIPTVANTSPGLTVTVNLTDTTTLLTHQQIYTIPVTQGPANVVTWTVSGTFNDGGALTGSFGFDPDSGTVSNWNLAASAGSILSAFTWTPANSTVRYVPAGDVTCAGPCIEFQSNQLFPNGNLFRLLDLSFLSPLTARGGAVNLFIDNSNDNASHECINCGQFRLFTQGSVTAQPPPAPIGTQPPSTTAYVLNKDGSLVAVAGGTAAAFAASCNRCVDMARDAAGNFIVGAGTQLTRYTSGGSPLTAIPAPNGSSFDSVAIDNTRNGNYIVADLSKDQILSISPNAPPGTQPQVVASFPQADHAYIRVDSSGNYILATDTASPAQGQPQFSLFLIVPSGSGARACIGVAGAAGCESIPITGNVPTSTGGLAFDAQGNYVNVDSRATPAAVLTITPSGAATSLYSDTHGYLSKPRGIYRDSLSGYYFLVDEANDALYTFAPDGSNFARIASGTLFSAGPGSVVVVDAPPAITGPGSLPNGIINQSYGPITVTATGGSGTYIWAASGFPAGISINATTGTIGGTPTAGASASVTVTVTDAVTNQAASASYKLNIGFGALSISAPANPATIGTGGSVSAGFSASGGQLPYTWSATGQPAGVTMGSTGSLSGSPSQAGVFGVNVTVTDAQHSSASASITINVLGLTTTALPSGTAGQFFSASIAAAGGTGAYTFSATGLPPGLSLTSYGLLNGTVKTASTYSLSVTVSSGGTSVTGHLSLTIVNPLPLTISNATFADGTVNAFYSQSLSATGGVPPYTWAVNTGSAPQGLSMSAFGTLSGTPGTAGTVSFGVQVTDTAGATATATASIVIHAMPITITTQSLPSGMNGVDYPLQTFAASGGTSPYTWALSNGSTLPSGMTLSSSGVLSGTPGATGTFSIGVTVTDSAKISGNATIPLTIRAASPDLILSTGSLVFSLLTPAKNPPLSQTVNVQSTVASQKIGYSVSVSPPASWLTVTNGTSTPDSIQVAITAAALTLGVGDYQTTITAACTSSCTSKQTVSVDLQVTTGPPVLKIDTGLLAFATTTAAPGPLSQPIVIENTGGGTIGFASLACETGWCTAGAPPASLGGNDSVSIPVTVNPGLLTPGFYRTQVDIVTSAGKGSVPVTLFIAPSSSMTLAPAGQQFNMPAGSAPGNPTGSFLVSVNNTNPVNWTAAVLPGASWLTLGAAGGTSSSAQPGTVSFSIDPAGAAALSPGAYYGRIEVTSPGVSNSPLDFEVVLNVTPASVALTPDPEPGGLLFITTVGGVLPPQTVTVYSGSKSASTFQTSAATSNGGGWLSVTPGSGSASAGAPGVTTVSVSTAGLKAGVYSGGVSYSLSATAIRTVNVTLIVASQPGASSSGSAASPVSSAFSASSFSSANVLPRATGCSPAVLVPAQTGLVNSFSAPAGWPTPLAILLSDDCGSVVNNGQIVATFSNGDPPLALTLANPSKGLYSGTWSPAKAASQVAITVNASAPGFPQATSRVAGAVVPNAVPVLTPHGTLHSFDPLLGAALAPGTMVAIYGKNLASLAAQTATIPLPTTFNGSSVIVGGIQAPLYYVSPEQINAQIPFELQPGQQYQVIVSANGALTTPDSIQLSAATPGLAALADGTLIAQHADGTLVSQSSPAKAGEYLVSYLAGMGNTTVTVSSGTASPSSPLASPADAPVLTINGAQYPILFAGLTPGLVGLYQLNFQAPSGLPAGNLTIVVSQDGQPSNHTVLPYQP